MSAERALGMGVLPATGAEQGVEQPPVGRCV